MGSSGPGPRNAAVRISVTRWLAGLLLLPILTAACGPSAPDDGDYFARLVDDRAYKDEFLKTSPDSRVPLDRRSWMVPLRYYDPDLSYRVPAQLDFLDEQPIVDVPTSSGEMREMLHIGHLEFVLQGDEYRLAALVSEGDGLFVPFRDETSGDETYPAGRYLDLPFSSTGIYDLDFNRAYHPDCYFDEQYECPYPPPQNRLATKVLAGEKLPPEDERRIPLTLPEPPTEDPAGQGQESET